MKRLVVFLFVLGIMSSQSVYANSTLKAIMKDMGSTAFSLRTQLKASPPDLTDTKEVQNLQKLAKEMLSEWPDKVSSIASADQKRLAELDYQILTLNLHREFLSIEEDMINGNATDALDHLTEAFKIQKAAHTKYK